MQKPSVPGDVHLSGELSPGQVAELVPLYKSWLFLNPEEKEGCPKEMVEVRRQAAEGEVLTRLARQGRGWGGQAGWRWRRLTAPTASCRR